LKTLGRGQNRAGARWRGAISLQKATRSCSMWVGGKRTQPREESAEGWHGQKNSETGKRVDGVHTRRGTSKNLKKKEHPRVKKHGLTAP